MIGVHGKQRTVAHTMATDLRTFLDIYAQPSSGQLSDRDSYEFRYATAALLMACSKIDQHEDPEEEKEIGKILHNTFDLSSKTLDSIMQMAATVTEDDITALTDLVNDYYQVKDKRYLLLNLWRVADADGRIDKYEEQFIKRIGQLIHVSDEDIQLAHDRAKKE